MGEQGGSVAQPAPDGKRGGRWGGRVEGVAQPAPPTDGERGGRWRSRGGAWHSQPLMVKGAGGGGEGWWGGLAGRQVGVGADKQMDLYFDLTMQ